jgi:hypothetical protein
MNEREQTLRAAYAQERASAALEGITPPQETAALREEWLSGRLSFDAYLVRLKEHYRGEALRHGC